MYSSTLSFFLMTLSVPSNFQTMEDARVAHDGTVGNAANEIMQFKYGGDGWDAEKVERIRIKVSSIATLRRRVGRSYFDEHVKPTLPKLKGRDVIDMYVPIDVRCLATYHPGKQAVTTDLAVDMASMLSKNFGAEPTQMIRLHVLLHLPTLTEPINYYSMLDALERKCHRAIISPGSMVGAISAVSLGEPCTQVCHSTLYTKGVVAYYILMLFLTNCVVHSD